MASSGNTTQAANVIRVDFTNPGIEVGNPNATSPEDPDPKRAPPPPQCLTINQSMVSLYQRMPDNEAPKSAD